jgi:DNA-binding CsgD family transcriptional regulator
MARRPASARRGDRLARAWTAAAKGELSKARVQAAAAAEAAVASGRLGLAYVAFHDLARLGDPTTASASLAEIVPSVDGPLAPICQEHVDALVARDPERLQNAATGFAALGANLLAAEAASQAAAAYRAVGRPVAARVSAVRAHMLAAKCPLARTPALTLEPVEDLTAREQEVASLAARGHSSRQIAERLVVSVRTVDNHLQHVYRKLGVSSRSELGRLLVGPEDEQPAAARLRR